MIPFRRRGLLLIILLAIFWSGWSLTDAKRFFNGGNITVSEKAEKHILYGSGSAGGHKFGLGKPCKSEFPQSWNDDKIISTVEKLAANDNVSWKKQKNGYFTADQTVDGVVVRVVLNGKKSDVITAYPVNGKRNPCKVAKKAPATPVPANDNYND